MKINNIRPILTALLGLWVLASVACKPDEPETNDEQPEPVVEIEINPDVDFSTYTTFDIVDPSVHIEGEPAQDFDVIQTQLEQAIVTQLTDKGLTRDTEAPQLLVNPFIATSEATDQPRFYESYYGWYYGYLYTWTVKIDYTTGSLLLDVVDQGDLEDIADDVLVYRGAAIGLMAQDIEVVKLQVRNTTQAIFADWPSD